MFGFGPLLHAYARIHAKRTAGELETFVVDGGSNPAPFVVDFPKFDGDPNDLPKATVLSVEICADGSIIYESNGRTSVELPVNPCELETSVIDGSMRDGQRVRVKLHGDDEWFTGTVIKARKMWVELEDYGSKFIADESNIIEWRPS